MAENDMVAHGKGRCEVEMHTGLAKKENGPWLWYMVESGPWLWYIVESGSWLFCLFGVNIGRCDVL